MKIQVIAESVLEKSVIEGVEVSWQAQYYKDNVLMNVNGLVHHS